MAGTERPRGHDVDGDGGWRMEADVSDGRARATVICWLVRRRAGSASSHRRRGRLRSRATQDGRHDIIPTTTTRNTKTVESVRGTVYRESVRRRLVTTAVNKCEYRIQATGPVLVHGSRGSVGWSLDMAWEMEERRSRRENNKYGQ